MAKLKEKLKKPGVKWSIGGLFGLITLGVLTFQNIGLKNQNNDLFKRYVETGNLYINSVEKYKQLKQDTLDKSIKYDKARINLKRENLKLAYKLDSLQEEYIHFAEEFVKNTYALQDTIIDFSNLLKESNNDLLVKSIFLKQERDFFKKYSETLDSLLRQCESGKGTQDTLKDPLISFKNSP